MLLIKASLELSEMRTRCKPISMQLSEKTLNFVRNNRLKKTNWLSCNRVPKTKLNQCWSLKKRLLKSICFFCVRGKRRSNQLQQFLMNWAILRRLTTTKSSLTSSNTSSRKLTTNGLASSSLKTEKFVIKSFRNLLRLKLAANATKLSKNLKRDRKNSMIHSMYSLPQPRSETGKQYEQYWSCS